MLIRPASHRDEGIVRADPKGSENPSPHLHHNGPWVFGLRGFFWNLRLLSGSDRSAEGAIIKASGDTVL